MRDGGQQRWDYWWRAAMGYGVDHGGKEVARRSLGLWENVYCRASGKLARIARYHHTSEHNNVPTSVIVRNEVTRNT